MRIGFISDIHANLEALEAALRALEKHQLDKLYCLGDIVGYGANPNECIERVRETCQAVVLGNHDAALIRHTGIQHFNSYAQEAIGWTLRIIKEENMAYLKAAPISQTLDGILLVHSTPLEPDNWNYIFSQKEAQAHFDVMDTDIAFIGHSHIPIEFKDDKTGRRIINVGSVGQPRDGDSRFCCGLYETDSGTFQWIRDVYPVENAAEKIRQAGLPEFLAQRLQLGM